MSKIYKFIQAIGEIIKKPSLLNYVLEASEVMKKKVNKKYGFPDGLPVVDLLDLCPNFEETVKPYAYQGGTCLPTDIALLKQLAKLINAETYFEIGTWKGESVTNVANIVKNCFTLNLSPEELRQLGHSETYINLHGFFSKKGNNITHLYGNSLKFDFSPYYNKCNLIFIDGDHHYHTVKADTVNAFKMLKSESDIIVWHDYSNDTEDIRWEVLLGILDGTSIDKHKCLYHVSNTLCAVYINREFSTQFSSTYSKPNKYFEVKLRAIKE